LGKQTKKIIEAQNQGGVQSKNERKKRLKSKNKKQNL